MILNIKQMLCYEEDTTEVITRKPQLLLTKWEVVENIWNAAKYKKTTNKKSPMTKFSVSTKLVEFGSKSSSLIQNVNSSKDKNRTNVPTNQ